MRTYDYCDIDLLSCQADNGSSSKYSWKIDKNKENQKQKKGYTFSKHGKSNCLSLTDSD